MSGPRLIPEWRNAWRYLSVQLAALTALVATAYDSMPVLQQYIPAGWMKWAALAIIGARLIAQREHEAQARQGAPDA